MKNKMFNRNELQKIRERAYSLAKIKGLNQSWKRVLLRLGDSANELDAYIARTEEKEGSKKCVGE